MAARRVVRDGVRLQALLHLQAVFEVTQEVVGVGEFRALAFGDEQAVGVATTAPPYCKRM